MKIKTMTKPWPGWCYAGTEVIFWFYIYQVEWEANSLFTRASLATVGLLPQHLFLQGCPRFGRGLVDSIAMHCSQSFAPKKKYVSRASYTFSISSMVIIQDGCKTQKPSNYIKQKSVAKSKHLFELDWLKSRGWKPGWWMLKSKHAYYMLTRNQRWC